MFYHSNFLLPPWSLFPPLYFLFVLFSIFHIKGFPQCLAILLCLFICKSGALKMDWMCLLTTGFPGRWLGQATSLGPPGVSNSKFFFLIKPESPERHLPFPTSEKLELWRRAGGENEKSQQSVHKLLIDHLGFFGTAPIYNSYWCPQARNRLFQRINLQSSRGVGSIREGQLGF